MLEQLISLTKSSSRSKGGPPGSISINTTLMWTILDVTTSRESSSGRNDVFDSTISDIAGAKSSHDQTRVSRPQLDPTNPSFQEPSRYDHVSPEWFGPTVAPSSPTLSGPAPSQSLGPMAGQPLQELFDWAGIMNDVSNETVMDISYDYLAPYYNMTTSNAPLATWWDCNEDGAP